MYKIAVVLLCVVLAGLQYRLWLAEGSYAEIHRLKAKIETLSERVDAMRHRNQELAAEIANLQSGVAAMEGRARSELGMVAPGETFYYIPKADRINDNADNTAEQKSSSMQKHVNGAGAAVFGGG